MKTDFFLAFIISIDVFLTAVAYRNSGIKIPVSSAAVVSFMGAAVLGISLKSSRILASVIPDGIFHSLNVGILTFIGTVTILKSLLRSFTKKLSQKGEFSLKMGKSPIILKLYLDETFADFDNSKSLSLLEASALALSNSFDAAAVGISCGPISSSPLTASVFAVFCGFTAFFLGNLTGKKIASFNRELSWIGGVFLIIFAVLI